MHLFPKNILKDGTTDGNYWPCATLSVYAGQNVPVAKGAQQSK